VLHIASSAKSKKEIIRETEDWLRAKESLEENILENQEKINNIELGTDTKTIASDIVSMAQNRLSKEQMDNNRIIHLKSKIEKDRAKLDQLEGALEKVKRYEKYYRILELKYIEDWEDEDIAEELRCDVSTVRRHRAKLIRLMAMKLYGADYLGGDTNG
jgi:DNA-directed RNA polymerase specialized sigma24 family protein